ncbi:hypothetical protein FRC07_000428 [Ceratobasidium sp. 392]|nr:hypothetical protein FRC07_000428 [Ceratobasidium sp. 392]
MAPQIDWKLFRHQLAQRGCGVQIINGQWEIIDRKGGLAGLPRKTRPVRVWVRSKPDGSAGRGTNPAKKEKGYQLQNELRMTTPDYQLVYRAYSVARQQKDAKTILQRTHCINMSLTVTKQAPGAVDLAIQKFVTVHREFEGFQAYGFWAPRAIIGQILRISSCQAKKVAKESEAIQPAIEEETVEATAETAADNEAWPELVPRKKPGPKPKMSAPTGEPALENKPAVAPKSVPKPAPKPAANSAPAPPLEQVLEPAPKPSLKLPQDKNDDDDGEFIDLNLPGPEDIDSTMLTAAVENSGMVVDISSSDAEDDDDDGIFDMSKATGKVTLTKVNPQPAPGVARPSPPPPAPPPRSPSPPARSPSPPPRISKSLPASKVSAAPKTSPAPSVSEVPALPAPKVSAPPAPKVSAPTAPANVSRTVVAPFQPPASGPDSESNIVWRGCTITPEEMAKFRSLAACQAASGAPARVPMKYRELTDNLANNPAYDPASEPDPLAKPAAAAPRRRGRPPKNAAPAASPDLPTETATAANPAPVPEQPKKAVKPKPKPKPKAKAAPAPEPEPAPVPDPVPAPDSLPVLERAANDESAAEGTL